MASTGTAWERITARGGVTPRRARTYGLVFFGAGLLIYLLFARVAVAGYTSTFVLHPGGATQAIPVPDLVLPTAPALYAMTLICAFLGGWQLARGFRRVNLVLGFIAGLFVLAFLAWASQGRSFNLTGMFSSALLRAVPIALAGLSGVICERCAVINIGIEGMMLGGALLGEAIALGLRSGFGDDRLRIGGVKYFADGSLGARTAWMLEPYLDGGVGLSVAPMAELANAIERGGAAGLPVGIHAIGDRAVRELLDVFSEVLPKAARSETGSGTSGQSTRLPIHQATVPHRIEHVQHSHPDDLRRLGDLGLVASVQPIHLVDDMGLVERALGERGRWAYAFRTLLDGGAVLAMGSDCPVASPNPFWGIHAAVTRQRRDGAPAGGWYPEERLTVAEAVAGYTWGPAYASGQLDQLGSITPGKLADLVVLDRDIFAIAPGEIAQTQVAITVFDGEIVYDNR